MDLVTRVNDNTVLSYGLLFKKRIAIRSFFHKKPRRTDNLKDELLYHQGLLAQEPLFTYYWVKFETEKKYFSISTLNWSRTLRFKIAERDALHSLQSETVKDAQLVLLNKSGFEIKRTPVGTVEAFKKVTGKIDLTETENKELYSVELHN